MSYSLKREIELYVNDVDSTDGVRKIAILPEFELKLQANLLQVYRKIIGEDPEMLPRSVVDQISPITLGFITYLKPAMLDGLVGHTAPEKLFYDSLGGVQGYRGADYYKPQFGRVNRLIPLYFFIKTTTAIYKINKVYVDSLEISFDINYILIGKWTAQAIDIEIYNTNEINFTNVKDYSNIDVYIRNKFTKLNVTDFKDGKVYEFPITSSKIKIQNALVPIYDKNIKVVTATVKDMLITGRAVSGEFTSYLSSKFNHSKDFMESVSSDLTSINRKYKIEYIAEDKNSSVHFTIPYAIINFPNLEFNDVLNTQIEFTSSESNYGFNDDIDIRYINNSTESSSEYESDNLFPTYLNTTSKYTNVVKSYGPKAYWRFNDNDSLKVRDHITGNYPLIMYNKPELGFDGPLLTDDSSKSIAFRTFGIYNQYTDGVPISTTNITEMTFLFWIYLENSSELPDYGECLIRTKSYPDNYKFTLLKREYNSGKDFVENNIRYYYYPGYGNGWGFSSCSYGITNDPIPLSINQWYYIAVVYKKVSGSCFIYLNGTLISNFTNVNITNYWPNAVALEIGKTTYLDKSNFRLSEFAYFEKALSDTTIKGIYNASGIGGFSYTITPSSSNNTINFFGNIPTIFRGICSNPISNIIQLTVYIPKIKSIFYSLPISKSIVLYGNSGIAINTLINYVPINTSINIVGNIPSIIYGKRILLQNCTININGSNIILNRIYSVQHSTIVFTSKIPTVYYQYRLIKSSAGELNTSGNTPTVKIITRLIKPSKKSLRICAEYDDINLVALYRFDDTSGTILTDYSSNSYHATLYNTPTLNQAGPYSGSKSIYFDKNSLEHAIYNSSMGSFPAQGSISFWVKTNGQGACEMLWQFNYAFNQGNNTNYFRFYTEYGTAPANYWVMPFGTGWSSTWQVSISDNTWTHIVITWNTSTNLLNVYKNNSVVINNGSHSNWPSSLQPLGICKADRDGFFYYHNAYFSDFALFNRVVSSDDILKLYNGTYFIQKGIPGVYIIPPPISGNLQVGGNIPYITSVSLIPEEVQIVFI